MPRLAILLFAAAFALGATTPPLTLEVSSETAPPGGYAQFKISPTAPALVSSASISIDFDPAIFGNIANVAAFSATGDQLGYAQVQGQHVTASFTSSSASLGQLPALPVLVISVPVLATAKVGTSSVTVDPTQGPWHDQQGNIYTVSVNPGTFTVGGTLSVQSVTPGGGLLPSGTVVTIDGTGFDATTTVAIDGVSLASTEFVSTQQINVTLAGATELTGKHLHMQTAGQQSDFFCSLPSAPANIAANLSLLLPLTTYTNVSWDVPDSPDFGESIALLNQNLFPVNVTFFSSDSNGIVTVTSEVIPSGETYSYSPGIFDPSQVNDLGMLSSAPMRMLEYRVNYPFFGPPQMSVFPPGPLPSYYLYLLQPSASAPPAWTWQIGYPAPQPASIYLRGSFPYTAVSSVPWLSVSPAQGMPNRALTLTPNVSALGAGAYAGTITIKFTVPPALAPYVHDIVVPVTMQVGATAYITVHGFGPLGATVGSVTPVTAAISVSTTGTPAQLSVSVKTTSGGNWLSAPTSGVAPGSITVTVNPSGLPSGYYLGHVVIQGPLNTISVEVDFDVIPSRSAPGANPASLSFALASGTASLGDELVILPQGYSALSVATQSGGNWLTASFSISTYVNVSASAVGLSPGTYLGTITLTSAGGAALQIPVTLVVLTPSAPLTVTPASVALTLQVGQTVTRTFTVTSNPSTLFYGGGRASSPYTPATVQVGFSATQPGTIYTSVTFTSGSGSVIVPVVLNVTASVTFPPILASVVSAASGTPSSISPGEIVSLYGTGIGSTPSGMILDATGKVATTLGGTQVLINGIGAPLIYTSAGQVNAIVPYEVSSAAATVQVVAGGLQTGAWTIPVAPSAPSIFTLSGSGAGPGAIVNQDGSINSASNPAASGTVIQIYATGGGQTSSPSSTGVVAQTASSLALPIAVTIGGVTAQVLYAGNAPGEVEGVVQINVIVPTETPGAALPILLTVGGIPSPTTATIAVQ